MDLFVKIALWLSVWAFFMKFYRLKDDEQMSWLRLYLKVMNWLEEEGKKEEQSSAIKTLIKPKTKQSETITEKMCPFFGASFRGGHKPKMLKNLCNV